MPNTSKEKYFLPQDLKFKFHIAVENWTCCFHVYDRSKITEDIATKLEQYWN